MLQQRLPPATTSAAMFRTPSAGALHSLVADHIVRGRTIFPGAGYLEMARGASMVIASQPSAASLRGVFFLQPLPTGEAGMAVECVVDKGHFEVRSGAIADGASALDGASVHCTGEALAHAASMVRSGRS